MENWDGVSRAYERSFAQLCAGTVDDLLEEAVGNKLLDAGCGTGTLLAKATARGFLAEGVDADLDMVAMSQAQHAGPVCQAALPDLPYADAAFDTVIANFVVNHVSDPRAAMRELGRVSAPDGRVLVTIWPAGGAGWTSLVSEIFPEAEVVPLPDTRLPAHLDFPRTTEGLADITQDAGLKVVETCYLEWTWQVSAEDLWAGIEGGVATPGQTYCAQTASVRKAVKTLFEQKAESRSHQGVMRFDCRAALVIASR